MAIFRIPTSDDAFYRMTTILDGAPYVLTLRYSERERNQYLTIALPDATVLASGIRITCGVGLLGPSRVDARLPPGEFVAIAFGPEDRPPGLGELGDGQRVTLYYADDAEVRSLRSGQARVPK